MFDQAQAAIPLPAWIAGTIHTVIFSDGVKAVLLYSTRTLAEANCLPDEVPWSQPSREELARFLREQKGLGSTAVVLDFHPATAKESPPPARHDIVSLIAWLEEE